MNVYVRFVMSRQGQPKVAIERRTVFGPIELGGAEWPCAEPYPDGGYSPVAQDCPEFAKPFVEQECLRQLGGGLHSARVQYE